MSVTPELPPRPQPARRPVEALTAWLRWFGLGRLTAGALSMLVVVGGAVWLLRTPAPPPEATLPVATGNAATGATLPPPTTSAAAASSVPAPSTPVPTLIVVHVAGAVAVPGVQVLNPAARVAEAVDAAGGPAPDADLDGINLAAPLGDGQRVYVPRLGEVDPASVPSGAPPSGAAEVPSDAAASPSGPVDVNVATAADLEGLPGIGPATATAIVDDRTRNGPFASVDDLERVSGIGPAKLAALRDLVTV